MGKKYGGWWEEERKKEILGNLHSQPARCFSCSHLYTDHRHNLNAWIGHAGTTGQTCAQLSPLGKWQGDCYIQRDRYIQLNFEGNIRQLKILGSCPVFVTYRAVICRLEKRGNPQLSEPLHFLENMNHVGWLLLISRFPQQKEVLAKRIPVKMEGLVLKQKVVSSVSVKWGMEERHVQVTFNFALYLTQYINNKLEGKNNSPSLLVIPSLTLILIDTKQTNSVSLRIPLFWCWGRGEVYSQNCLHFWINGLGQDQVSSVLLKNNAKKMIHKSLASVTSPGLPGSNCRYPQVEDTAISKWRSVPSTNPMLIQNFGSGEGLE